MSTAAADTKVTCPECGRVSHHPQDIAEDYCGRCHVFNGGPEGWMHVASRRRLGEAGPLRQYPPERCPVCDGIGVLADPVVEDGTLLWWCWSWSCRANGLAAGRPPSVVQKVGGFVGRVD
ncbi:hypothetical protein ACIRPQ_29250 [Streptomyces sp. NPDC101213]|uniref:hypothetical protein n=1 Tax=Streptomyces sp. NPDC101213 TaxID=3366130 RepID=UPI0037F3724B